MDTISVIYQFNEKYVPYAGVSITSLLINNAKDADVVIYVLGEGLSEGSRSKLSGLTDTYGGRMIFPDTSKLLARFEEMGMIPYRGAYSVYLRMFFDEFVDETAQHVIYLDADTVVDKSLLPLVNTDLGGKSMGMVLESIRDDYKVMIGMKPDSDYYNSGMILFDTVKWRENKYGERLADHIRNVRSSYVGDQDFLNIVCEGDIAKLSLTYNFQPLHGRYMFSQYAGAFGTAGYYSESEVAAASDAVIYHCYRWLGEFPWNAGNLHPFNDKFDEYLAKSPWSGYVKEKADPGIVLRLEKFLYRILPKSIFIRIFKLAHELMLRRAEIDARKRKANRNV